MCFETFQDWCQKRKPKEEEASRVCFQDSSSLSTETLPRLESLLLSVLICGFSYFLVSLNHVIRQTNLHVGKDHLLHVIGSHFGNGRGFAFQKKISVFRISFMLVV